MAKYDKLHKGMWLAFYLAMAYPKFGGIVTWIYGILLFAVPIYSMYRFDDAKKNLKDVVEHPINVPMVVGWIIINWLMASLCFRIGQGYSIPIYYVVPAILGGILIFGGSGQDMSLPKDVQREKSALAFSAAAAIFVMAIIAFAAIAEILDRSKKKK